MSEQEIIEQAGEKNTFLILSSGITIFLSGIFLALGDSKLAIISALLFVVTLNSLHYSRLHTITAYESRKSNYLLKHLDAEQSFNEYLEAEGNTGWAEMNRKINRENYGVENK